MNEEKDLPDIFYSKLDDSLEAFITTLIKDQNKKFSLSSLNAEYYKNNDRDLFSFYDIFFKQYQNRLIAWKDKLKKLNSLMKSIVYRYSHDKIKEKFDVLQDSTDISSAILKSIQFHFAGRPYDAFECIEELLNKDDFHLLHLFPILRVFDKILFRVRNKRNLKDRIDLYHIPYEKRHLCSSERYSIPGYASLYLSGSLKTALSETKVHNKKYSSTAFKITTGQELKLIDLSLPNRELNVTDKYCFLAFYPLIVACSLKVKYPAAPYKPEYLISQDIFSAVRLHYNDIDGFSYASIGEKIFDFKKDEQRNYVLYVRHTETEKGYSKDLSKKLLSTKPVTPKLFENIEKIEEKLRKMSFEEIL